MAVPYTNRLNIIIHYQTHQEDLEDYEHLV